MGFKKIVLENWRQLGKIDIDFHPRITIITGANGSGKSTILQILSQSLGWAPNFLNKPILKNGKLKYQSDIYDPYIDEDAQHLASIGKLKYTNNKEISIAYYLSSMEQNNVAFQFHSSFERISGVYIPSHRFVYKYNKIDKMPTVATTAQAVSQTYTQSIRKNSGEETSYTNSPLTVIKENLISMAAFGPGNEHVQKNETLDKLYRGFNKILKIVLPKNLGFEKINIILPDVLLQTKSGDFLIDASSGGIMSIIDMAWQIFMCSHNQNKFTVVIDEPENHLHPSMQRSLLNDLARAFPQVQFIISTHSPFIINSVKDSYVYVLKKNETENNKVYSYKLDLQKKAATANEILRDVLGVPVTIPTWADEELQEISNKMVNKEISSENLKILREELKKAGLGDFFPEALNIILNEKYND